jgi:hypothetical protein
MTTATNSNVRFTAYDQLMLMREVGERYQTDAARDEWEDFEEFGTEEAAAQWISDRLAKLTRDGDLYHVTPTRYGLDSIEYHELCIIREDYDPEYDEWVIVADYDGDVKTTLPDDVRDAALDSQKSYHAYLDYETNLYHGIDA